MKKEELFGNLNDLVPTVQEEDWYRQALGRYQEHLAPVEVSAKVKCFFRELDKELIKLIDESYGVVGCVAWLTHPEVLDALSKKDLVSIVVQKEDFLRPDSGSWSAQRMMEMYGRLKSNIADFHYDVFDNVNRLSSISCDPIRWLGNLNTDKAPAFPRMHHKFLVFCKRGFCPYSDDEDSGGQELLDPCAVWTGSFNVTKNAGQSIENAVLITESEAVYSYFNEWRRVWLLSHSIDDWHLDQWEPNEHRIGS
jgi:hypothetical protein